MRRGKDVPRLVAAAVAALHLVSVQCRCDLRKVDGSALSPDEFRSKYWEKAPLVITNLISDWPAVKDERWVAEALLSSYGGQTFDSSHVAGNSRKGESFRDGTSLADFLTLRSAGNYSWFLEPHAPLLRDMLRKGDFSVPAALEAVHREGPFLSVARKGQWNPFHNHENSWFAQVLGAKRWFVLPPDSPGVGAADLGDLALDLCASAALRAVTSCDLRAGQVIYLPSRFTHGTCALREPSVGLAFIGSPQPGSGGRKGAHGKRGRGDGRDLSLRLAAKLGSLSEEDFWAARPKLRAELLRTAAASDSVELVERLCQAGARCGGTKAGGSSPLVAAVEAGASRVAEHLADVVGVKGQVVRGGQSLLHLAAAEGHVGIAELLLRRGLDPSAADASPMRNSPAFLAAWHGHLGVLKLLLAKGAEPGQANAEGLGLWHLAALESYFYVIDYLHGLVQFDLDEFLEWSRRANAPSALISFIQTMIGKRTARRKEL